MLWTCLCPADVQDIHERLFHSAGKLGIVFVAVAGVLVTGTRKKLKLKMKMNRIVICFPRSCSEIREAMRRVRT